MLKSHHYDPITCEPTPERRSAPTRGLISINDQFDALTTPNAMGVTGFRRLLVAVVLGVSVGLNMFTSAIVNLALPSLATDFNADIATVQWVILAYFVTIASLHLPMGRLGDRFGRRRIFLIGATIFALGALLSGFASGLWPLVAMRVVQGFGGGIMQAIGPPLLVSSFPDSERGRATGIIGLMIAVGLLAGPAAGGLLIGALGWQSIFFANVPVAGFVLIVGALALREPAGSRDRSYDLTGAVLAAGWIAPLVFFLSRGFTHGWSSAHALAAVGLSGALLLTFVIHQRRQPRPLLNLGVFRNPGFLSAVLISYLGYGAYTSVMLLGPFLLQNGLGFPVARVGLLLAVVPAVGALVSIPAGELTDRFGHRWPRSAGLLLIAGGSISRAGAVITLGHAGYHPAASGCRRWPGLLGRSQHQCHARRPAVGCRHCRRISGFLAHSGSGHRPGGLGWVVRSRCDDRCRS